MPAAIAISKNQQDYIKKYLQETYDITIVDAFDCQTLSDAIYKEKAISISCSTLRRLFDLVPNTNTQSRFILNAMAVAVGFKNWDVFKTHVAGFDANMINQNIQIYSRKLPNSNLMILETIRNLPLTTWLGGYQLQSIVTIAIENKDFELLDAIVRIPFEIDNHAVYEHLVIAFQSFYFQSIKRNNDVVAFVERNIAHSTVLQKCLLQAYVDESHLDGFLGLWFDAIEENILPDLLLFKNLLLCQKAINSKEVDKAKTCFNLALKLSKQNQLQVHPILKARISVWNLVLNNNEETIYTYFNFLSNPFYKADFAVIASRLLWTYNDEVAPIPFLEHISLKEFPSIKNFFQKGRHNVLLLTLAIHYHLKQEHQKSQECFKLFNATTLGYDIVNIEFYLPWIDVLSSF